MPFLSAAHAARPAHSAPPGAVAAPKQTLRCSYLSAVLLVCLLNATLG
ncbi:hypothetical protein ACF059_31375 [Streptomyces sp. NPDC016562]